MGEDVTMDMGVITGTSIPDNVGMPEEGGEKNVAAEVEALDAELEKYGGSFEIKGDDAPPDIDKSLDPKVSTTSNDEQMLKDAGIEGFKTLKEYHESRTTAGKEYDNMIGLMNKLTGQDFTGKSAQEISSGLETIMLGQQQQEQSQQNTSSDDQSQKKQDDFDPKELDAMLDEHGKGFTYENQDGDEVEGFHPQHREFYKGLANMGAKAAMKQYRADAAPTQMLLGAALTQLWYANAQKAAGDAPMPPIEYVYQALQKDPNMVGEYLDRTTRLGQISHNPLDKVIADWRTTNTPSGETNAKAADRDTQAKKVATLKRELKPSGTKATKQPTTDEELEEFLGGISLGQLG